MKRLQKIIDLIKSNKIMVLLDQVIFSGSSFLTTILLARNLGIEAFGIYSSIVLMLFLYLAASNALIIAPFQVMYAKEKNINSYITSLLIWQVVVCIIFIVITLFIEAAHISALKSLQDNIILVLFLIITFLLQDFFRKVFIAISKLKEAIWIDSITNIAQILWLGYCAFNHTLTLSLSLFIMAATFLPSIILGLFFLKPKMPSKTVLLSHAQNHIKNGKWLLLTAGVQWWANNLFVVASGLFVGVRALGALRLAQTLFGVLNVFLQVYENYVLPVASGLFIQSSALLSKYLRSTTFKSMFLLVPVSVVLIIFSKQIFLISGGAAYVDYAYVLQGMVILYLLIFSGYPLRIAIRILLLNKDFFIGYIISLVFSLLAAKFLISNWGLAGVVSGLIINQLLVLSYWQIVLIRKKFMLWS